MSTDDSPSRFGQLRQLASAWTAAHTARLKYRAHSLQERIETPESWVESAGGSVDVGFTDRSSRISKKNLRKQLKEYHNIRVDGGIIAALLEARALMVFGVGGQFTSEADEAAEWLNDQFDALNLLTYDLGADATFYGYSLGEVRETEGDDFGKLEFVEPWTTVPDLDRKGEITQWEQQIKIQGQKQSQLFDTDDIWHFKIMKSSGRDPLGMSLLGRGMTEAMHYQKNQKAIQNAVQLHGFPKWHVQLGREGGAVIDDNELRRARPMFDDINELTKWVTGQDVDIEAISPEGFEFETITEHDLSKLAIAFMLPVELTQIGGGDGLGTGFPAKLRERMFLLSAQSQQNQLGGQLVEFGKHLLREYSSFDEGAIGDLDLRFDWNEPITDLEELQTKVDAIGDDMTVNERREVFGMPPVDDDEVGEEFDSPAADGDGDDMGLFQETDHDHDLADRDDFWWEDHLNTMAEKVAWGDDTDHALFGFSEGSVPEFVKARMQEAVLAGSPIFSDIESISAAELGEFRMFMADELQEDGWTITGMRDQIADEFDVEPERAETMARSTTQNMVSEAAESGYRERDDFEDLRFTWSGPDFDPDRSSEVCQEIKEQVPEEGLPMDDLKELAQETANELGLDPRGWSVHPNCRHRPLRVVD